MPGNILIYSTFLESRVNTKLLTKDGNMQRDQEKKNSFFIAKILTGSEP